MPVRAQASDASPVEVAVLHRQQSTHLEAVAGLLEVLECGEYQVRVTELPTPFGRDAQEAVAWQLRNARPALVVAGGTQAAQLALEALPETPVVFYLVANALDAPFMAQDSPDRRRVAGVAADVSPAQQLALLTLLAPDAKIVGVLRSERSSATARGISTEAARRSLQAVLVSADKDTFVPAIETLDQRKCHAALMIPDAEIFNAACVQRLLLWGIRQKCPVLAFSTHLAKAGALAGVQADSKAIGRQAGRLVERVLRGDNIADIGLQYPSVLARAVNLRTAELIGIKIDADRLPAGTVRYGSD